MIWQELGNNVIYRLFLCDSSKKILAELNYTDINFTLGFQDPSELNFEMQKVLDETGVDDPRFYMVKSGSLILTQVYNSIDNTLLHQDYFIVESPNIDKDNTTTKKVQCKSKHYIFLQKQGISYYKQVSMLYDNVGSNGIINYMLSKIYNIYTVSYISSSLLNLYRSFDYKSTNQWKILNDLSEQFNCIFIFDNINSTIQIKAMDEVGINTDTIFNDRNFILKISSDERLLECVTRLYVYGNSHDINIRKWNKTGQAYIDNFDSVKERMPSALATRYNAYEDLLASKDGDWVTYRNQLNGYQNLLETKTNELKTLQGQSNTLQLQMDAVKVQSGVTRNNATYDSLFTQQQTKIGEIATKQAEIDALNMNITTVNNNISALQTAISWDTFFTLSERQQLMDFVYTGDDLTLDSISDDSQTEQLYNYALEYLKLKSKVPVNVKIKSVDLLSCYDLSYFYDKVLRVGDYLTVDCPDIGYDNVQLRIIKVSHNPISNELEFTCSNQDALTTDIFSLRKVFAISSQAATTLAIEKSTYSEYSSDKTSILFTGSTIDTTTNPIKAGNNVINQRGMIGSNLNTNGVIEYLSDAIVISKDNGKTFRKFITGEGLLLENYDSTGRVVLTGNKGFQIDKWELDKASGTWKWDNKLYIEDETGNLTLDGAYLSLLSANNKNQILLNPDIGIKVQKTNGSGGWIDKFYVDNNGEINLSGNINMNGGSIIWDNVNKPTVSQIGAVANDQTSVFNTLTNNGALRGLFMQNGNLYMNADYIKAGTIQIGSIPTLDDTKIQSASNWNSAESNAKGYADTLNTNVRTDLRLTAPLPTSLTLNSSGIKASTSDPNKYAVLDYRGLYINNGALQINNTNGQTLIDGSGVYSNYIIGDFISTSGWTGTGTNHIKIQKNLMYFKEDNDLTKMAIGFLPNKDNVQIPLIVLGAGDGYGNNRGYIQKDTDGLSMYYVGDLGLGEVSYLKLLKDKAVLNGYEVFSTKSKIADDYITSATNWNTKLSESEVKAVVENPDKNWNIPEENLSSSITAKLNNIPILPSYIQSTYIDNAQIQSPTITGGVITGGIVQSADAGSRVVMSPDGIKSYDGTIKNGWQLENTYAFGQWDSYFNGTRVASIITGAGGNFTITAWNSNKLILSSPYSDVIIRGGSGNGNNGSVQFEGGVDFTRATVMGLVAIWG